MPRREDEYAARGHPQYCTCVACNERRLGRREDRQWTARHRERSSNHPDNCGCSQCRSLRQLLGVPEPDVYAGRPWWRRLLGR